MKRAIMPPTQYPAVRLISDACPVITKIVAFISIVFSTIQICRGTYKGFIKIFPGSIKIL
jgi:hypothetical protein